MALLNLSASPQLNTKTYVWRRYIQTSEGSSPGQSMDGQTAFLTARPRHWVEVLLVAKGFINTFSEICYKVRIGQIQESTIILLLSISTRLRKFPPLPKFQPKINPTSRPRREALSVDCGHFTAPPPPFPLGSSLDLRQIKAVNGESWVNNQGSVGPHPSRVYSRVNRLPSYRISSLDRTTK